MILFLCLHNIIHWGNNDSQHYRFGKLCYFIIQNNKHLSYSEVKHFKEHKLHLRNKENKILNNYFLCEKIHHI